MQKIPRITGASGSILVTQTFRDWKSYVLEQVSAKKYDALRATQDATEAEWSEKLKLQETEHEKRILFDVSNKILVESSHIVVCTQVLEY